MPFLAFVIAAGGLVAADLPADRFNVEGVRQGMTLAEYNALISKGRHRSEPVKPDEYRATINGRKVQVGFCRGYVDFAALELSSYEWLQSWVALKQRGFEYSHPFASDTLNPDKKTWALLVKPAMPADFGYAVLPTVTSEIVKPGEPPATSFILFFSAVKNRCGGA